MKRFQIQRSRAQILKKIEKTSMTVLWSSPIGYRLIRMGLGGVFLYSGLSKAFDLVYFSGIIDAFGILPSVLTYPVAVGIVTAELALGAGLVFDLKGSLAGILIMLLGFISVAGYAIAMGYDIDCGCFGPSDPEAEAFSSLRTAVVRDLFMVAMVAYLYGWRYKNGTRPSFFSKKITSNQGA